MGSHQRERILVLVRGQRDGVLTRGLLERAGLVPQLTVNVEELCDELKQGAAAALVAEELLTKSALAALRTVLAAQPVWSDLPIVVFSSAGEHRARRASDAIHDLGNVTFLDRPVQVRSMLASVNAAIRSRKRQYETRRAIESRDAFLAMLGHELRNPLGAIRLAAALLETKGPHRDPSKELAIIDRQSLHLSRIVDELLDVARVTQGKVVLKLERLSLTDVVRNAYELMKRVASGHLATFDLVIEDDDLSVDGDRQRLEQVFTNLMTNAIKYTPRGGSVTVRLRAAADGQRVIAAIEDNGVGLAPDMRDRVFEVFAQAERSLDRAQGGIGIGLALVRGLVELHGGEVHAESEGLGRGSTFVLTLPRAPSPAPELPTPVPPPSRIPARRIVVVEDNEDMRQLLVLLLEGSGHEVTCAEAGPEGLEKILKLEPDVAFVDIGLPHMDGLEVARRVRAVNSRVRLVAMTGYGQLEDKAHALEAGFDAHLTKPVESADLHQALERS